MAFTLKTAAVIGTNGFIGRNLVQHLQGRGVEVLPITRDSSHEDLPTSTVDCVFFCAGNGVAYMTDRDPEFCIRRNIIELYQYIRILKYRCWVHFSTTSVYPDRLLRKTEDAPLDVGGISLYGAHKLLSERYVAQYAPEWLIVRPTYLFGPGLRRNLFFDLLTGRRDIYLKRDSHLAALHVTNLAEAVVHLAEVLENEVVNVGSAHVVSVDEILAMNPGDYVFHDERFIDERGVVLDKLHRYWREPLTRDQYVQSIRRFFAEPTHSGIREDVGAC